MDNKIHGDRLWVMSIHVPLSKEAELRLRTLERNTTISAMVISVLTVVLIFIVLGIFLLPNIIKESPTIVTYSATLDEETVVQEKKVQNQVKRKPSAPSSSMVKVIASSNISPISIPVPDIEVITPNVDFGDGEDFGSGWGDGDSGSGGGAQTAFGRTGGGGLEGKFYDLKQNRAKAPNSIAKYFGSNPDILARLGYMTKTYKSLENSRFSESSMNGHYRAGSVTSFSHLVIPSETGADLAPKSFGVEKEVEPSAWVVVYEGRMSARSSGEYQFVGMFDDLLLVYVDDRLVLDASFISYSSLPQPTKTGAHMRQGMPLIEGKWVKLTEGTKVRIVVAESPGGHMGGGLFIREKGKSYRQAEDAVVLPPFTTAALTNEDKEKLRNIPKMGAPGNFPIEVEDVPVFPAR
jgi:hypothetical protein